MAIGMGRQSWEAIQSRAIGERQPSVAEGEPLDGASGKSLGGRFGHTTSTVASPCAGAGRIRRPRDGGTATGGPVSDTKGDG